MEKFMEGERLDKWRFERKYLLSKEEFVHFEKMLLYSDIEALYPDREINNCYIDDPLYNGFIDSMEGYAERKKIRIRWYGDFLGEHKPKLEFKIKQNNSNKKETFSLKKIKIDSFFNWEDYIRESIKYLKEEHNIYLSENLLPTLLNSYKRSYYANFQKTFRLTIDHCMSFYSPTGATRNIISHKSDFFVIELKFNNEKIIQDFQLNKNLGKFSKYTTGVMMLQ